MLLIFCDVVKFLTFTPGVSNTKSIKGAFHREENDTGIVCHYFRPEDGLKEPRPIQYDSQTLCLV